MGGGGAEREDGREREEEEIGGREKAREREREREREGGREGEKRHAHGSRRKQTLQWNEKGACAHTTGIHDTDR